MHVAAVEHRQAVCPGVEERAKYHEQATSAGIYPPGISHSGRVRPPM